MEDLKLEQAYKEWKAGYITAVEVMNKSNMTQAAFYRKVKDISKLNDCRGIFSFWNQAENIKEAYGTKQVERINILRREGIIKPELIDIVETLRRKRNVAMHEVCYQQTEEANSLLHLAFHLSTWFIEVYGDWNFQAPEYIEPNKQTEIDTRQLQQKYEVKVR